MLFHTHIIIAVFFILYFIDSLIVGNKLYFVLIALVSSILPDIDSRFSTFGKKKSFRPIQWFVKHRGILHSFSFLILVGSLFYIYYPIFWFPFVLGYGVHLVSDSFTKQGIKPFYPLKWKVSWKIRTGKRFETFVFVLFFLGSLWLGFEKFYK